MTRTTRAARAARPTASGSSQPRKSSVGTRREPVGGTTTGSDGKPFSLTMFSDSGARKCIELYRSMGYELVGKPTRIPGAVEMKFREK